MTEAAAQAGAATTLTVASLNLYHWAEPGLGWYGPEAGHSPEGWQAKRRWLSAILGEMDADVVGFQEVVSIASLRDLCAAAGYPHFAVVAEPVLKEAPADGAHAVYYRRPVNAVASRAPIAAASEPAVDPALSRALGFGHERHFRRPPVRAEIAHPAFGPVVVYCAHLKSPGVNERDVTLSGDEIEPEAPGPLARWRLQGLSRATAYAMIQRMFEACALQHAAMEDIAAAPARPVILLGDMNDTPDSAALAAMTPYRAHERDGGAAAPAETIDAEAEHALWTERYRLVDAARLAPRSLVSEGRAPTHRSGASGEAIDHILVSGALRGETGRLSAYLVHDAHFRGGEPATSSDHAGVSARFERAAVG